MNNNSQNNQKPEDYLPCRYYNGNTLSEDGIYNFAEDGKFYFSFIENGNVILRSEGYASEAGRENGIDSILKNKENESQYKVLKLDDGTWVIVLEALNHQEIARSCPVSTEAEARELLPGARSKAREAFLLKASVLTVPIIKNAEKEDDYLLCSEYHGHLVTDKLNQIAVFTHKNGQYYFAVYNDDGSVKLRSEGFGNTTDRDKELGAVITYINSPSNYSRIEKAGYDIKILKDNNGKEIGRTCPKKIFVAAVPMVSESPAAGGFKWWWLLPLLLLIPLFLWWNSCNKPAGETPAAIETPAVTDSPAVNENAIPVVKDTDGDGISDADDKCPNLAGIADNLGCPEMILYYKRDEALLNADDKAELDKVVAFLNNNSNVHIILEGHTSTLGETDYNQKLSEKRANNSVEYLVSKGIDAGRLKTVGYGEQFPIGDNNTEEGRSKSRRTVIKVDK